MSPFKYLHSYRNYGLDLSLSRQTHVRYRDILDGIRRQTNGFKANGRDQLDKQKAGEMI